MRLWLIIVIAIVALLVIAVVTFFIWARRSAMTPAEASAELRALGVDFVRLPGRLRRVAAEARTPRRARWWLIGLAVLSRELDRLDS